MAETGCLKDGHFQNLQVDGLTTLSSNGTVSSKFTKKVAFVTGVTVNSTAGDSAAIGEFAQPADTLITDIKVFCAAAPVIGAGDIGFEVGTTSSGVDIVAAVTDGILDNGVTVSVGHIRPLTLVAPSVPTTTATISIHYAATARPIYCNITNTQNSTTDGSFTFIIEYVKTA